MNGYIGRAENDGRVAGGDHHVKSMDAAAQAIQARLSG